MTRKSGEQTSTLYDVADHALLVLYRWYVNAQGYVVAHVQENGKVRVLRLARVLLGMSSTDPRRGDHINGDILDNRRANLRIVSHQRNVAHQAIANGRGTSRFRNVHWDRRRKAWSAGVKIDYVYHHIGTFRDEQAAAAAVARFRVTHGLPSGY